MFSRLLIIFYYPLCLQLCSLLSELLIFFSSQNTLYINIGSSYLLLIFLMLICCI